MTVIEWDKVGQRTYETGVSKGVLYGLDNSGDYVDGVGWNGLVSVTESPSGAEANKQYADNIVYVNLRSAEEFGATIEAFSYPDEWNQYDGFALPSPGIALGQQGRRTFGLSYQTLLGNDIQGTKYGFKIHLVYGATASPSERSYQTVNESPEAATFSWEVTTVPVNVTGHDPVASITVDSTKVDVDALEALMEMLYGTVSTDAYLPSPDEVLALFDGTVVTTATTTAPTYNSSTDVVTIPSITGVVYELNGEPVTGTVTITKTETFTARPAPGYRFPPNADDDWTIVFA